MLRASIFPIDIPSPPRYSYLRTNGSLRCRSRYPPNLVTSFVHGCDIEGSRVEERGTETYKLEPPHSPEAEMALLGALMIDDAVTAAHIDMLAPEDLYSSSHQTIALGIRECYATAKTAQLVPLTAHLRLSGQLDRAGGVEYLMHLVETTPVVSQAGLYLSIVRQYARRRRALSALSVLTRGLAAGEVNGQLAAAREALDALDATQETQTKKILQAQALLNEPLPNIEYVIWPLVSLGSFTQLQGEPKSGKSCFALYCALTAAIGVWPSARFRVDKPRRSMLISYEDGPRRLKSRLLQYLVGLSSACPDNLYILSHRDAPSLKLDTQQGVRALNDLIERNRIEYLTLDTLSHLHSGDENSKQDMQPVVDAIKHAAKTHDCGIMASHHTAKISKEQGQRSVVYRGRGSSAIAAAADVIIDWGVRIANITQCSIKSKDDSDDDFNVHYRESADKECVVWSVEEQIHVERAAESHDRIRRVLEESRSRSEAYLDVKSIAAIIALSRRVTADHLVSMSHHGEIEHTIGPRRAHLYRAKATQVVADAQNA